MCISRDHIYLPTGRHNIKWLEPLNSGGLLRAVSTNMENNKVENDINVLEPKEKTIVTTEESENVFLSLNVILDCRQVRFGIWNKCGAITIKNCQLIGDRSSSTAVGIVIAGEFILFKIL